MKRILFLTIFCLFLWQTNAQNRLLRFNKNKTFKIVQITDTHFDHQAENRYKTIQTIKKMLEIEKPDFVIVTGDIVSSKPAKDALLMLANPIVESGVTWSATLGNHDVESDLSKKAIWEILSKLPHFIGEKGVVSGVGNNMLPIFSSDGKSAVNALFLFDSHAYTPNPLWGHYDWIKFDQVAWYRVQSDNLAQKNDGKPLPSLAFFHIPLKEYHKMSENNTELIGDKFEGVASPEINSGLFASMMEKKNIMGVFVGHDHDNNYIGLYQNIALGFGQVTGANAYGKLERGCRVIELQEGEPIFKTWIRTPSETKYPFYFPSGLTDIEKKTEIIPATKIDLSQNGVNYTYFEGKVDSTTQIQNLSVKKTGIISNFSLSPAEQDDYFAFRFETWIKIPETAYYRFFTRSDDGSRLFIDGKLIVDNDSGHSAKRENGTVALEKGFHKIELLYFENYMGEELSVGISSKSIRETKIPDKMLFREG